MSDTGTTVGRHRAASGGDPTPDLRSDDRRSIQFELVREGALRDGIEIVHYEPRFPAGSRVERRLVRTLAALFLLGGVFGAAFVAVYVFWPDPHDQWYTPLLGITLGASLFLLGAAVIAWAKKLLPHEVAIEQRHDGPSSEEDRRIMGATLGHAAGELSVARRPLLKGAITLGLLPLGVAAAVPILGALIRDPHEKDPRTGESRLTFTGWDPRLNNGQKVRLVREDGTPVRPSEVSIGGQITVFPGIPGGTTNEYADSPVLLIHLREQDAEHLREHLYEMNQGSMEGNFVAYSKICTHAGCPPSLYEQQTNRLLCPCHQSQFLITENARPIFGPAARALPMLPIELDDEGFFVASSDFKVPVGPSFWER
ncbi:MAG TPA: Rieske 2Fe-2S domain-containing protein [Natronosporangium sp.]|nr:Rieske 2Fe-2S domain-containing protein [Natronosporangium sp.]